MGVIMWECGARKEVGSMGWYTAHLGFTEPFHGSLDSFQE